MKILASLVLLTTVSCYGQTYTSYFTGNTTDLDTNGQGGICMMGGASEQDDAMIWFLERANGGDVLVLRASGSDGYNDYMFTDLGVTLNSVETIVCNSAAASDEAYVQQAVQEAEAIWFAGGDQWDYISYWRETAIDTLINENLANGGLVIGGTSAGMAIQGGYYFSAENGTVTSAQALSNPYQNNITVDNTPFLNNPILADVITDTHYDNPDRKGRHVTFMARMIESSPFFAKGIACNEYVAVCIDENGIAKVYGEYPAYEEYCYFIQVNCDNADTGLEPETMQAATNLEWNRQESALIVYKVPGTLTANNSFDLNDWKTGNGGEWQRWWVEDGVLMEDTGVAPDCSASLSENSFVLTAFPNPTSRYLNINSSELLTEYMIYDLSGKIILTDEIYLNNLHIDLNTVEPGQYILEVENESQEKSRLRFNKL
ncbi:MAG: T9SS type A sorting domain-containing protein [Crocinitomicaceae bacterium]